MYAHSTPTAAPVRSRDPSLQAAGDVCSSLRDVQSLILEVGMQEAIARCLATPLDVTEGNECSLVGKEEEGHQHRDGPVSQTVCMLALYYSRTHKSVNARTRYVHSPASWGGLWEQEDPCACGRGVPLVQSERAGVESRLGSEYGDGMCYERKQWAGRRDPWRRSACSVSRFPSDPNFEVVLFLVSQAIDQCSPSSTRPY